MVCLRGLVFLVVLAVVPSIDSIKRCGVRDVKFRTLGRQANYKWTNKSLTYMIHNYPPPIYEITPAEVDASIAWAFQTWTWYIDMNVAKVDNIKADINIYFETLPDPEYIGWTQFPPGGRVSFKPNENWHMAAKVGATNFNWIAIHELGHALGLWHNETHTASPMYPSYVWNVDPMPTPTDFRKIADMYGMKPQYKNCYHRMGQ